MRPPPRPPAGCAERIEKVYGWDSHEASDYPREIVEASLAHASGDAVELAYRRTDFLDKRRALMEEWARFCLGR